MSNPSDSNLLESSSIVCVSFIVTSFDENDSLIATLRSIEAQRTLNYEIIVIDDGSEIPTSVQLGCRSNLSLIRHGNRTGIATSRCEGATIASGNVLCFLDAHQIIEKNAVLECAELALSTQSIVCPDIADFDSDVRRHGAYFTKCAENGYFSAKWKQRKPISQYGRVSSLKAPAYFVPTSVYPAICWNKMLRGWGGSEAMISLKAFFADVPILHLCGPLIRHKFKTQFHYPVGWDEVWRNHAIIARTCFDDETWNNYWLPRVFKEHLSEAVLMEMNSSEMMAERAQFVAFKVKSDAEFWTDLIFEPVPPEVRLN